MAHIPPKMSDADVAQARQLLEEGRPMKDVAAQFGVSRAYVSMIKNKHKRDEHVHRIPLRSGGSLTFTTNIKNFFDLSEEDQQLLNRLLDLVHEYEQKEKSYESN